MSALPPKWDALFRTLNRLPGNFGAPGVRDPDAVCEAFDGDGYDGTGDCSSDGHYMCTECSKLSSDAPRFIQYGAQGRLDRIRARVATLQRRKTEML